METRSNLFLVGGVVAVLLAALVAFTGWMLSRGSEASRGYDVFFSRSVQGLAAGSPVTYAGVASGEVDTIEVWRDDPSLVRVRIRVTDETPILEGTTASLISSLTGSSSVGLEGGRAGRAEISCPADGRRGRCPLGVPVIPVGHGGAGALGSGASEIAERVGVLAERFNKVTSDRNRAAVAAIAGDVSRIRAAVGGAKTDAVMNEYRRTARRIAEASRKVRPLVSSGRALAEEDVRPLAGNAGAAIRSGEEALAGLRAIGADVRAAKATIGTAIVPEARRIAPIARRVAGSVSSLRRRAADDGALALIAPPALPEFDGRREAPR